MRKLLAATLLTCITFICTESHAQEITESKAMEIAMQFISQAPAVTRGVPALEKVWDSNILTSTSDTRNTSDDTPTFHTFSIDRDGFVIVAGEEVGNNIIAYSFDAPVSEEIPAGMIDYLNCIDSQIRSTREKGRETRGAVTEPSKLGKEVVNLNTAEWGQNTPFNKLCFTEDKVQAKTGCVPTAFAIVMRHHKWPVSRPVKLYNPITGDPVQPGHIYDWDNMPLNYNGTYTDEQATQVATVMRDLGYAYMVIYGTNSTEGNPNASKMQEKFNYIYKSNGTSNSGMFNRATTGETEWVRLIKESLDNNCPIPYQATNSGSGSDAKHIFILDGYTDNDYYHFNWGWNGAYNGYYTLANMDPTSTDQYAGGGTNNHYAIFNLKPQKSDVTITATVNRAGTGTATVNGQGSVTVEQGSDVTLTATPAESYLFTKWTLNEEVISQNAETTVKAMENAEYTAHFTIIGEAPDITISVEATEGGTVSIDGKESATVKAGTEVTMTAVADEGYIFENWSVEGTAVSTNATFTTIANDNRIYTAVFSKIEKNETVTIKLYGSGGNRIIESGGQTTNTGILTVNKGSAVTLNTESKENTFAFFTSGKSYKEGGIIISNKRPYTFTATVNTTFYFNYTELISTNFDLNTTVTATANTGGTARVDGSTTKNVKLGDEITLTAIADNGYKFTRWTVDGETVGIEPVLTTIVQKETTYTANFEVMIQTITISVEAGEGGSATVNGGTSITVEDGEEFTLTATADEGYVFSHWSIGDNVVSTEPVFTTTAESSTVYTANFESTEETVTEVAVTINQYGSGTYCSGYALDFRNTGNIKAYVATGYNNQTQVVTLTRIQTSKPAIGLYLVGEPGEHRISVIENSSDNSLNMLAGTLEDAVINSTSDDGAYANFKYTITEENAAPMFHQFQDNTPLSANKAYLQIPVEWLEKTPAKSVSIRLDEMENSTPVEEIQGNANKENCTIYDLTGRKINNITVPDIYIINGKKTIIKPENSTR